MEKELIIRSSPTEVEIAMLEDSKLVEIHKEKTNSKFTVGDIFIGSVKKLMPGLNAAFIDIGHRKDAFLHYTDLGPKLRSLLKFTSTAMNGSLQTHLLDNFKAEPDIIKTGKINEVLRKRQHVLVQILKEPISTKGPRLSCELTIPGRYLVLSPFSSVVAISKKIANAEERKRLQMLIESIKPKNFGVIVRTAAEGRKVAELHEEMTDLLGKWEMIYNQLKKVKQPVKLLSELDKTTSILRDVLNDSFNRIVINDGDLYRNVRSYLRSIEPDKMKILSHYKANRPIFEKYGVTRQIKSSFGKTSTMSSGGIPRHRTHRGHARHRRQQRTQNGDQGSGSLCDQGQYRSGFGDSTAIETERYRGSDHHRLYRYEEGGEQAFSAQIHARIHVLRQGTAHDSSLE